MHRLLRPTIQEQRGKTKKIAFGEWVFLACYGTTVSLPQLTHLDFVLSHRSSESAGTSSGDLADLGTSASHAADGAGLTHVLLVTTTVGVINGVHGNTSHLRYAKQKSLLLYSQGRGQEQDTSIARQAYSHYNNNNTYNGPLVSLGLVLVERTASLEDGLIDTSTASHNANGGSALVAKSALGA